MKLEAVIPADIFAEARKIVASHKPDDSRLRGFEPELELKIAHHEELNGYAFQTSEIEHRRARFGELRNEYVQDAHALEQLDIYDGESQYSLKLGEYSQSFRDNDLEKQRNLEEWFVQNYPITGSSRT